MRSPNQIIKHSLEELKKINKSFSMRSLAKALDISPGYLSKIINGKKNFPEEKLEALVKILRMDNLTRDELEISLAVNRLDSTGGEKLREKLKSEDKLYFSKYEEKGEGDQWLLEKWYRFEIWSLLDLKTFSENPNLIANELGLKEITVEKTLKDLAERGYIELLPDGKIKSSEKQLRFTGTRFSNVISSYQDNMIQLARKELLKSNSSESFDLRLITSQVFTLHNSQVSAFKSELSDAFRTIVNKYRYDERFAGIDHDCLYHLNYQLFPTSHPKMKKTTQETSLKKTS